MLCRFSQPALVLSLVAISMSPAMVSAAAQNPSATFSQNEAQNARQPRVHYQFSFANAVHNEALVTVRFSQLPAGPLPLQFSNASPGRYARHDFAKNIYQLTARNSKGETLPLVRLAPSQWQVMQHDGSVDISYRLYGDHADGTYNQIDHRHAHLNMPATVLWSPALQQSPISLSFIDHPADWQVATQLPQSADGHWLATDLDELMDSPIELSRHTVQQWTVPSAGKNYQLVLATHHQGTTEDEAVLLAKTKAVVAEQMAIFGELPDFDHGRYVFINDFLPGVSGDGMEHRNSTIVTSSKSLYQANFDQLGTISHEFFHAWNVERIRPASLEPFLYHGGNMSESLWFAEGVTSYYGDLALKRSGHYSEQTYLALLARKLNRFLQSPGRQFASALQMSQQAPFVDAAVAVDQHNYGNSYISYYLYGDMLGLALDLTLRQPATERNLDQLMRLLWQRFGKTEQPYQTHDLQTALADSSGDKKLAADFFSRYIEGNQLPDFKALFAPMGLVLQLKSPTAAAAGPVQFRTEQGKLIVASNSKIGSPLYQAGIDRDDVLLQLGRDLLTTEQDWQAALAKLKPGQQVELRYQQYGEERSTKLMLGSDPELELVTMESLGQKPAKAALQRRAAWLDSALKG